MGEYVSTQTLVIQLSCICLEVSIVANIMSAFISLCGQCIEGRSKADTANTVFQKL